MKTKMIRVLLGFLIYTIVFSGIPYMKQKDVSDRFKENFDINKFYSKDSSSTYAQIIRDNDEARIEKLRSIDNAKDKIILSNYRFLIDSTAVSYTHLTLPTNREV